MSIPECIGGAVPAVEPGNVVLSAVYDYIGRFVSYPTEDARVAHALWVAHTHLMDVWDSTPRLAFLSPEPGSGKSRALEVTENLVPRPVIAVNMTSAYLFRKVGSDKGRPTLLHDEIDAVFGPNARDSNSEEKRALINAGHRKGAVAGRCVVRGKAIEPEEIPAYAAVALAGLGDLPDTILTRSVIIRMRRRAPTEQIEPYRQRVNGDEGKAVGERLATWGASVAGKIELPKMPPEITDRQADVWEALLAVADAAGGDWPERARKSANSFLSESKDNTVSLGVLLLRDLRTVFGGEDSLSTDHIIQRLCELDEAPWSDLHGKAINARGVAFRLRQYGVKSCQVHPENRKGYTRESLWDAWQRYLPPLQGGSERSERSEQTQQSRGSETFVSRSERSDERTPNERQTPSNGAIRSDSSDSSLVADSGGREKVRGAVEFQLNGSDVWHLELGTPGAEYAETLYHLRQKYGTQIHDARPPTLVSRARTAHSATPTPGADSL